MTSNPYNLERFLEAQEPLYDEVCKELRNGKKQLHWMWFIFPQIAGLGKTSTAKFYSIKSLDEAKAYLSHPILGPRLLECTALINNISNKTIDQILGSPDNLKFRSCMTLFAHASEKNEIFLEALEKYYDGKQDQLTLDRI